MLLKVVYLHHDSFDHLIQISFSKVNLFHWQVGSILARTEPNECGVGVCLTDLMGEFKKNILLWWLEVTIYEVCIPAPDSIETAFA